MSQPAPTPESSSSEPSGLPSRQDPTDQSGAAADATVAAVASQPTSSLGGVDAQLQDGSLPQPNGIDDVFSTSPAAIASPSAPNGEASKEKKRFSLDAFRLPFLSSPKKVAPTTSTVTEADESELMKTPVTTDKASQSTAGEDFSPDFVADAAVITDKLDEQTALTVPEADADIALSTSGSPGRAANRRSVKSALCTPNSPSKKAARATSPHRVSFSPSTEEMAEARERALLSQTPETQPSVSRTESESSTATTPVSAPAAGHAKSKIESPNKKKEEKLARRKSLGAGRWRGFKSHSTSDLTEMQRQISADSSSSVSTSATASSAGADVSEKVTQAGIPTASKRRFFKWDRHGIHQIGPGKSSDKGKIAKVKVTKHQAVAARHAKTLEQVINAGMGLHPVPPRLSSAMHAETVTNETSKGKKGKVPKARAIPVAEARQLKGLKSALIDISMANGIIAELRSMPVPLDSLQKGIGRLNPETKIGTAGEHGNERVLVANLPDVALDGQKAKDDSEIRKRSGATMDESDASAMPTRPPLGTKAKSAAEEALRKLSVQAEKDTLQKGAIVTARTSSLPSPVEEPAPALSPSTPAPAPVAPKTGNGMGARPLKMVCLDCGEQEAHRRHVEHLDSLQNPASSETVVVNAGDQAQASGPSTAGLIAAGAAAALAGAGGFFSRSISPSGTAAEPKPSNVASVTVATDSGDRPGMMRSMSLAALPTLQDGQRLMGSKPLQLLMDPVGSAAEKSGAFDVLANVSGAAIRATQDMDNIHPPIDRMAIFVHWWGFEITLPKATMAYLGTAHSISGAFLSFLQTMAVGGGVPELLPFIRYISTFMEVEYKAIQAQDMGNGVCVAATWFMPLALVPRPWDYPLDGPQEGASDLPGSTPSQPIAPKASPRPVTTPLPVALPSDSQPALPPISIPNLAIPQNQIGQPPKKHMFKKKSQASAPDNVKTTLITAVMSDGQQPIPPKRNISPSQMAAIQAAQTEKIPRDLENPHSGSSRDASTNGTKLEAGTNALGLSDNAALASLQEGPEGSVLLK